MIVSFINKTDAAIDENRIINAVKKVFKKNKISDNSEASISIVHHDEVVKLAVSYMKETPKDAESHPVLSFLNSELEDPFVFPPDDQTHLGEIVVSLDKAIEESKEKSVSLNEVIQFWAEHGAMHLSGVHHD